MRLVARAEQGDGFAVQAAGHEREHPQRIRVEPLQVVDDQQHRPELGKQGQHGDAQQQPVGATVAGEHAQGGPLPRGEDVGAVQHGPQQLVQAGERDVRLEPVPGRPQDQAAGLGRGVVQAGGLAGSRAADQDQGLPSGDEAHPANLPDAVR